MEISYLAEILILQQLLDIHIIIIHYKHSTISSQLDKKSL